VIAAITTPAFAAKKDKRKTDATASIRKKLDAASLPADVREKANKVLADDGPKLNEAQAKIDAILTSEQKQAKRTAQKEARSSGAKGKNARASIDAAMKLTPEQKTKLASAEGDLKSAQATLTKDLRAVLTPEQAEKAGLKTKKKNKA
jgi:Spy/CpxP family protein refolding chaperone